MCSNRFVFGVKGAERAIEILERGTLLLSTSVLSVEDQSLIAFAHCQTSSMLRPIVPPNFRRWYGSFYISEKLVLRL